MNIDNKLNELFNISPVIEGEVIPAKHREVQIMDISPSETIDHDCDTIRTNLYSLLECGQDALEESLEVAKASENPRAYEVFANMLKQMADINLQILDIHTKKQRLVTPIKNEVNATQNVTNNSIFVGTASALNDMIENMTKGKKC